ncbi:cytochrome P450 [Mycena capillaripes]|nr:cytochrome P450 [Mycena capillaripes]
MNVTTLQWNPLDADPAVFATLSTHSTSLFIAGIITLLAWKRWFKQSSNPLPPGPSGLPIIGNALHLPLERQWLTFTDWAKTYGEIVHVSAFGQSVVILNSPKAVSDLLERRSTLYSDRPQFCFLGNLVGYADSVPLANYGDRHREYRKLMSEVLGPRKVSQYHAMEEQHMRQFLRNILQAPERFRDHIHHVVACIVFDVSHGYTVAEKNDPMMTLAHKADDEFTTAVLPGRYLCDVFPILRFIPDWMAGFKQEAKRFRRTMESLRDEPYAMVKDRIAKGTAKPSFTASLIERDSNPSVEQELIYKWVSSVLYSAGADTSGSAIASFFLALSTYPSVQQKANEELDRVVGRDRLPTFEDRPKLPYIQAIVTEASLRDPLHRWNPVAPIALPHQSVQDDVYNGFHIPAGATVFANSWGILHEPSLYPSPNEFIPERFLAAENSNSLDVHLNPDPRRWAFGYGRRVCPGRDLAEDMLFISVAMTLAVFDLRCIEPTTEYTPSIISHPMPFKCAIAPRSREAAALLIGEE